MSRQLQLQHIKIARAAPRTSYRKGFALGANLAEAVRLVQEKARADFDARRGHAAIDSNEDSGYESDDESGDADTDATDYCDSDDSDDSSDSNDDSDDNSDDDDDDDDPRTLAELISEFIDTLGDILEDTNTMIDRIEKEEEEEEEPNKSADK